MNIIFNKKEEALLFQIKIVAEELGVITRIAGGYVRDKLLGRESHDIDIAVEGMSGAEFASHFGKNYSVISARPDQSKHLETAIMNINGVSIDVAGLRKETYADSRIPIVETGTPEEDASRRDLTVNALFYNLHTEEIEDYVGGLDDLKNSIANTPLEAKQTFLDDPLRILRCIRFCAKYGFEPTSEIIRAAQDSEVQNAFLNKISKERIFAEVVGIAEDEGWKEGFLTGPNPSKAMHLVIAFDFMDIIFSPRGIELNPWDTDQNSKHHDLSILFHTLAALTYFCRDSMNMFLPQERAIVNLALICHDLGKRDVNCRQLKDDGTFSYLTHDDRSVELAEIVLDQISCPNDIKKRVLLLVKHHMRFHALDDNPSKKSLRKILRDLGDDTRLLLEHSEADSCGKTLVDRKAMAERHANFLALISEVKEEQGNSNKVERPINGHELAEMGVPKGPQMGDIFRALDEELLENPGMTKDEAKDFVNNIIGGIEL